MMVKYVSGKNGREYILNQSYEIAIREFDPYSSEWDYESIEKDFGIEINSFKKKAKIYNLALKLRGTIRTIADNLEILTREAEIDILHKVPGRLYVGDYYTEGYFVSRTSGPATEYCGREVTLCWLAPRSFWIKEVSYYVPPVDIDGLLEINTVPASLENPHYTECDFLLKAYGPFDELFFYVNDNQYRVVTSCKDGEYLLLDTRNETIVKVDSSGNKTNAYASQVFTLDNFKKIPAGSNSIRYKRNYAIEITLFQERSEPKWNEAIPNTHFLIMTEDNHPILTEDGYYLIGEEMVGGAI